MAQYASGKHAIGYCDICGFQVPYKQLRQQYREQRRTNLWVCPDCVDKDVPRRLGPIHDPQALHHPRPDGSLEASRRILHWKPVDSFQLRLEMGAFEVRTDANQI
jgi:hypothetical protein